MELRPALSCAAVVLATLLATPAAGHHSLSNYDASRPLTLDGRVTAFRFVNPHAVLVIEVEGRTWALEMDNRFELVAIGMTETTFRPGDRVRVTGSPAHEGPGAMYLRRLDRPADGLSYEQRGFTPSLSPGRP